MLLRFSWSHISREEILPRDLKGTKAYCPFLQIQRAFVCYYDLGTQPYGPLYFGSNWIIIIKDPYNSIILDGHKSF